MTLFHPLIYLPGFFGAFLSDLHLVSAVCGWAPAFTNGTTIILGFFATFSADLFIYLGRKKGANWLDKKSAHLQKECGKSREFIARKKINHLFDLSHLYVSESLIPVLGTLNTSPKRFWYLVFSWNLDLDSLYFATLEYSSIKASWPNVRYWKWGKNTSSLSLVLIATEFITF